MGNSVTKQNFHEINVDSNWVLRDVVDPCLQWPDDNDFDDLLYELKEFPASYPEGFTPLKTFTHLSRRYPSKKRARNRWKKWNRKPALRHTASIVEDEYCRDDAMSCLDLSFELALSFDRGYVAPELDGEEGQWAQTNSVDPSILLQRTDVEQDIHQVLDMIEELGMSVNEFISAGDTKEDLQTPPAVTVSVEEEQETVSEPEVMVDENKQKHNEDNTKPESSGAQENTGGVTEGNVNQNSNDDNRGTSDSLKNDGDDSLEETPLDSILEEDDSDHDEVTVTHVNIKHPKPKDKNADKNKNKDKHDDTVDLSMYTQSDNNNDDNDTKDDDNKATTEAEVTEAGVTTTNGSSDTSPTNLKYNLNKVKPTQKAYPARTTPEFFSVTLSPTPSPALSPQSPKHDQFDDDALTDEQERERARKLLDKRRSRRATTKRGSFSSTAGQVRASTRRSAAPMGTVARMMEQFGEEWLLDEDSEED